MLEVSEDSGEARLIEGLLRGDRRSGDVFYNRYAGDLYTFIFYRVAGNEDVAGDLLQDTLVAALAGLDRYRPYYGLLTWIRGIARHKIVDYYRASSRSSSMADWGWAEEAEGEGDIQHDYEVQESRDETLRVLRSLPPHYQQVLTLKYVDGESQSAIATHLGHSIEAIESLLARARRAFRIEYGRRHDVVSTLEV